MYCYFLRGHSTTKIQAAIIQVKTLRITNCTAERMMRSRMKIILYELRPNTIIIYHISNYLGSVPWPIHSLVTTKKAGSVIELPLIQVKSTGGFFDWKKNYHILNEEFVLCIVLDTVKNQMRPGCLDKPHSI